MKKFFGIESKAEKEEKERKQREAAEKEQRKQREAAEKEQRKQREAAQARAAGMNPDALATLSGHTYGVTALTLLSDGRLASGSCDNSIKLWNVRSGACESTFSGNTGEAISALTALPNGFLASGLFTGNDARIIVWNVAHGRRELVLSGHNEGVYALTVLPEGRFASGSSDKTIRIWNVTGGRCESMLSEHTGNVCALTVLPNGFLASGSDDNTIKIWNVARGQCEATLSGHTKPVTALTVLPNGFLASGSYDHAIKVWNLARGKCEATLSGHTGEVTALMVLPNGFLASGSKDTTIKVWNLARGECEATLSGHTGWVMALTVLPDGFLASGSDDKTIKFWDVGFRPVLASAAVVRTAEGPAKPEKTITARKEAPAQKHLSDEICNNIAKLSHVNEDVRCKAARALQNLAMNAENKIPIAQAGAIAPLVRLLSDSESAVRGNAAGALTNLAVNAENQQAIREAGGITPLIRLLSDSESKVRVNAVIVLSWLATNDSNQQAIREAGGITPLIRLLSDSESKVRVNAVNNLSWLARNDTNRQAIREAGGITLLIRLLSDGNQETRGYAASALGILAQENEINRKCICENNGVELLLPLLLESDSDTRRFVVSALAHLTSNDAHRDKIREAGGITLLVEKLTDKLHIRRNDVHIRRNDAIKALFYLVINHPGNEAALVKTQGLSLLEQLAQSDENDTVRVWAKKVINACPSVTKEIQERQASKAKEASARLKADQDRKAQEEARQATEKQAQANAKRLKEEQLQKERESTPPPALKPEAKYNQILPKAPTKPAAHVKHVPVSVPIGTDPFENFTTPSSWETTRSKTITDSSLAAFASSAKDPFAEFDDLFSTPFSPKTPTNESSDWTPDFSVFSSPPLAKSPAATPSKNTATMMASEASERDLLAVNTAPLSRAEFETLMVRVQRDARPEISLTSIEQTLLDLQQRMSGFHTQITTTFSLDERRILQARISADQITAHLLIERRTIHSNKAYEAYYLAIQMHFSGLMVASLGIGSGYVDVTNSQAATVVGWICTAISSVFPGASIVTSMISAGVNYLDAQYREVFLEKVKIFGTTITEAEVLGEQVARLLVRAHVHAKNELSLSQADKDAKELIHVIVKASQPLVRNETAAESMVKAILGHKKVCLDPLPAQVVQLPLPPAPLKPPKPTRFLTPLVSPITPVSPVLNASSPNSPTVEELMRQLEEERAERKRQAETLAQLQTQMQNTALRSEVASKKDLAATQAKLAKLEGTNTSGGGQMLMTKPEEMNGAQTMEEQFIALKKELAQTQDHLHYVTQQTITHQEKWDELEQTQSSSPPPYAGSRNSFLPPPPSLSTNKNAANDFATAEKKAQEEAALRKAKGNLFSKMG